MKILHSLWTKPLFCDGLDLFDKKIKGNWWTDKKFFYFSWALSCLQFRKFYNEVELVTDAKGKELFIDKLNLPYTNVKVVLDNINNYSHEHWALGKIYAMGLQETPFIHADGDVFIWEEFDNKMHTADLVCQNLTKGTRKDNLHHFKIMKKLKYLPEYMNILNSLDPITSIHAGLIGGSDVDFFKLFKIEVFKFMDRNAGIYFENDMTRLFFNNFYEEHLFYCLALQNNLEVHSCKEVLTQAHAYTNLWAVPRQESYVHPHSWFKAFARIEAPIEHMIRKYYPDYYFRILDLLENFEI